MLPSVTKGPSAFHLSLLTFHAPPHSLPHPLPGAVCGNLCSVAAGAHAAPTTPVIFCRIVKKQVAALIRAFSNQRRVRITEEGRGGLGERGQHGQRRSH